MSAGVRCRSGLRHGFLFNRGEKCRNRRHVVDPFNLPINTASTRALFLREVRGGRRVVPFGQDGNYNHEAIVRASCRSRQRSWHLAQRSLSMIAKQLAGVLRSPGPFAENDKAILAQADGMIALARTAMATQQFTRRSTPSGRSSPKPTVISRARHRGAGQDDPPRQRTVLYVTAEVIRQIAFSPNRRCRTHRQASRSLAIPEGERDFAALGGATRIKAGRRFACAVPVFPRYVEPSAA